MSDDLQRLVIRLLLNPEQGLSFTADQWTHSIWILRECSLLARLYSFSQAQGCYEDYPAQVKHHLFSAHRFALRQQAQSKYEANELTQKLSTIGVKPIFLKGVAYVIRESKAYAGRTFSDIDVLVKKDEISRVEKLLVTNGWMPKATDQYDNHYYRKWSHEIPPIRHLLRGTVADIHHNLIPIISGRAPRIELFTQELMQTDFGLTLSTPAMILHSCVHLFNNEEFTNGLRDLLDLHLLFSDIDPDSPLWNELYSLAKASGFTDELIYAQRYCSAITNTQFPEAYLQKLKQHPLGKLKLSVADFIFMHCLMPHHPDCMSPKNHIAHFVALLRGHFIKMPMHILIYHSLHKLLDSGMKLFVKNNTHPNTANR